MSANDQILIKKHKGKWYVFNVMAESWSKDNELSIKDAEYVCYTKSGAYRKARKLHFECVYLEFVLNMVLELIY